MTALRAEFEQQHAGAAVLRAVDADPEALRRRLLRLAFDVHDGPMQNLVAIGYAVRELQQKLGVGALEPNLVAESLASLVSELGSAEAALRSLITRLEHGRPEVRTLEEILAAELRSFSGRSSADVHVDAPTQFQPDSHSQALAIAAVLREALTNIAKYAQASEVQIRVEASPDGILLEIHDDGIGFDPAQIRPDALGLAGMKQRVALLGGTLTILSRLGGPTVITARFERWDDTPSQVVGLTARQSPPRRRFLAAEA